eukprot:3462991-Prymnesium_polylepis.1
MEEEEERRKRAPPSAAAPPGRSGSSKPSTSVPPPLTAPGKSAPRPGEPAAVGVIVVPAAVTAMVRMAPRSNWRLSTARARAGTLVCRSRGGRVAAHVPIAGSAPHARAHVPRSSAPLHARRGGRRAA